MHGLNVLIDHKMNFASPYVLNDAVQTDIYEVVSDDEFNEGIELSDSGSDEESSDKPDPTFKPKLPGPPPPPPPARSSLGRFMNMLGGSSRRAASESNAPRPPPKSSKLPSWKSAEHACSDAGPSCVPKSGAAGQHEKKRVFRRANTNVVSIRFDTLKKSSAMHAGEAISCSDCQAILSQISHITEDGPDKVWKCEFCGTRNVVEIEDEERPTADDVTYLMEPALTTEGMSASGRDESIVVFCIDTSGSMTITTEVPGHLKLRGSDTLHRLQRDSSFEGPQHLPREARNVTYISRLQALQAAVDHQLGEMAKEFPDRRIALVTFSCDVCVIGDGTGEVVTATGSKLQDKEELARIGASLPAPRPIKETRASLGEKVFGLEEGGSTALGPALIIALSMASQHPGSKVILCTDGKSNEGVGKVENLHDDEPAPEEFYESIAATATAKGVSMSVITIKGTDCKLIHLGKLADTTGGQVNIVDPLKLTEEFSNVLADRIIATNVTATFILHHGLYIGKVENESSKEKRVIGNVRADHEISFEYGVRRRKVKKTPQKPPNLELARISEVPSFMEESLRGSTAEEHIYDNAEKGDGRSSQRIEEEMETEPGAASVGGPDAGGADEKATEAAGGGGGGDQEATECDIPSELPFQLQIQYTDVDGTKALRVLTQKKPVTTDRKVAEKDADLNVLGVHTTRLASELALQGDYSGSRGVALMNHRLGWRSSRDNTEKARVYQAAFRGVKNVENSVLSRQKKEISAFGCTHSDEEDEPEETSDEPLAFALPPAHKKCLSKKQMRSEETEDDFARDMYQSRSSSSAHVEKLKLREKMKSKLDAKKESDAKKK